eukprot:comp8691_c1_seq1/m.3951 comp8691_c1_seq1/g.3951  ORF comp8691_c1_seq1/g.3951 comp8691_c1_seq1/m.3951 type:complete len:105 (-) comp8691_c1_seq1:357-671(-)
MEGSSMRQNKTNSTDDLRLIQAFFAVLTPPPSAPSSAPASCASSPVQTRRRGPHSNSLPTTHARRPLKNMLPSHLESDIEGSPTVQQQSSATRAIFYSNAFSPF